MKLVLPQSVRSDVEAGLPKDLDIAWYDGRPEDCDALADAEAAWINILDGGGQARAIEAGPKLKWVTTIQAGVNTWPLGRMKQRGLLFTNGAGLAAPAMGEFVVMGMLAVIKNLKDVIALQAERRWAPWLYGGGDLAGAKVLIIGYGSIGRAIAQRLEGFEVEVTGVRRHPSGEPGVIGTEDWRGRLGEFDWIVLAAASTRETARMIGREELAAMKPSAGLVNIARGDLIDQAALMETMHAGALGGAFLDVTDPEPAPQSDPIWTTPGVILTSHTAGRSHNGRGTTERAAALFLDNLQRYVAGQPLRNQVDLELGY